MIRIFLYLVFIAIAAAGFSWLAGLEGFTVLQIEGTRIDVPTGLLIGLLLAGLILFFFGGTFAAWLAGLPSRIKRRGRDRRRDRGLVALARGLEAVAAGDGVDAQRHARTASKALAEPTLTRLLTAQAAQLAGDNETAERSYAAMLEAPETEFLGLRGLYMQAMARGEPDYAQTYAERAFELRPGTPWAFESVLDLHIAHGSWGDALETLRLARQNNVAEGPSYKRMEAALLTAQAYAAYDSGDQDTARKDAEAALKKAAALTPAAALAAECELSAGHRAKAAKLLDSAWEAEPHPGLAAVLRRTFAHERDEKLQGRLLKLAERNPDHPESVLLRAQVAHERGEHAEAQDTLAPLLAGRPNRRVLLLMASIAEARYGAEAPSPWQQRAAAAPAEVVTGLDGSFHYTSEGWRRLIREFSEHARLAPPPLEVETPELPAEEVRALLAPPLPPLDETVSDDETALPAPDEEAEDGVPPEPEPLPAAKEGEKKEAARESGASREVSEETPIKAPPADFVIEPEDEDNDKKTIATV
jgi:HemY protein